MKIVSAKEYIKMAVKLLNRINNYKYDYRQITMLIDELCYQIDKNVSCKLEEVKLEGIELEDCNGLTMVFDDTVLKLSSKLEKTISNIIDSIQMFVKEDTDELEDLLYECQQMFSTLSLGNSSNSLFWIERKSKKIIYIMHLKILMKSQKDCFLI